MATAAHALAAALRRQLTHRARPRVQRLLSAQVHSKNPFEIHFHPDDEEVLRARKLQQASRSNVSPNDAALQDDIRLLHAEMADIFGDELEEYDGSNSSSNSSSNDASPSSEQQAGHAWSAVSPSSVATAPLDSSFQTSRLSSAAPRSASRQVVAQQQSLASSPPLNDRVHSSTASASSVLVLQGPCSYVRGVSVSTRKPKHELLDDVHRTAAHVGTTVDCRDSNVEGEILEWLLAAAPGSAIVLCWNARLSDSPLVVRALSLVDADVVIVSPLGVEHGALPASVRGVISGVEAASLELALRAVQRGSST